MSFSRRGLLNLFGAVPLCCRVVPVNLTYRSSGPWGEGQGAPLATQQIDKNFWELHKRLEALEGKPGEFIEAGPDGTPRWRS